MIAIDPCLDLGAAVGIEHQTLCLGVTRCHGFPSVLCRSHWMSVSIFWCFAHIKVIIQTVFVWGGGVCTVCPPPPAAASTSAHVSKLTCFI